MNITEIKRYTWNFFRNKGLSEKTVSAIMGNIMCESGFNPDIVEIGNDIGFGLCQWSFTRRKELENYGTTLTYQLFFLWSELTGENIKETGASKQWIYKKGYLTNDEFLDGEGSIEELTKAFCYCFERPNVNLAHIERRIGYAKKFYSMYSSKNNTSNSKDEYKNLQIILNDEYDRGLVVDGIVGIKTLYALPVLKFGQSNRLIKWLQSYICNYYQIKIDIDGIFGNESKTAVIKIQKLRGLTADGIVEINTWKGILK